MQTASGHQERDRSIRGPTKRAATSQRMATRRDRHIWLDVGAADKQERTEPETGSLLADRRDIIDVTCERHKAGKSPNSSERRHGPGWTWLVESGRKCERAIGCRQLDVGIGRVLYLREEAATTRLNHAAQIVAQLNCEHGRNIGYVLPRNLKLCHASPDGHMIEWRVPDVELRDVLTLLICATSG